MKIIEKLKGHSKKKKINPKEGRKWGAEESKSEWPNRK